jgi:hypothetical protein
LKRVFLYEPSERATALDLLDHPYFDELRQEHIFRELLPLYSIGTLFDFKEGSLSDI